MTPSEFIKESNLTLDARFVPHYTSRNKNDSYPQLNWIVTISNGRYSITTDYSQGVGHLPYYAQDCNLSIYQKWVEEACETGKWFKSKNSHDRALKSAILWSPFMAPLPAPAIEDVVYSLMRDAEVLNYTGFEDWADNYGYDSDSIKAKSIFDACIEIALPLKHLIDLEQAQVVFQDY